MVRLRDPTIRYAKSKLFTTPGEAGNSHILMLINTLRSTRRAATFVSNEWLCLGRLQLPDEHRRTLVGASSPCRHAHQKRLLGRLDSYNRAWDRNFELLKQELSSHDDNEIDNRFLHGWVKRQKLQLQKRINGDESSLSDQRLRKIVSLETSLFERQRPQWNTRFQQLTKFRKEHPNVWPTDRVKGVDKKLVAWCNRQRAANNNNTLPNERIQALDALGFPWSLNDQRWHEYYAALQQYKATHNDCLVPICPRNGNASLARWVEVQRTMYRKRRPTLTQEKIDKLDRLGFVWDANEYQWSKRFNELADFVRVHGCLPTRSKSLILVRWLKYQAKTHTMFEKGENSSMTCERVKLLEQIGVRFKDGGYHFDGRDDC